MNSNSKFLKFWSILNVDCKHWEPTLTYFLISDIKITVTNSKAFYNYAILLGMPELIFKLLYRPIKNCLVFQGAKKTKLKNFYSFFDMLGCFIGGCSFFNKKFNNVLSFYTKGVPLCYSNYNIFSMFFYFKFDYALYLNFLCFGNCLWEDMSSFFGLPTYLKRVLKKKEKKKAAKIFKKIKNIKKNKKTIKSV